MTLGWHKQRALERRLFGKPKAAPKPEPTLDEQIERVQKALAGAALSRRSRGLFEKDLERLLARKRVREALSGKED